MERAFASFTPRRSFVVSFLASSPPRWKAREEAAKSRDETRRDAR